MLAVACGNFIVVNVSVFKNNCLCTAAMLVVHLCGCKLIESELDRHREITIGSSVFGGSEHLYLENPRAR